jgi:hypothetical protein
MSNSTTATTNPNAPGNPALAVGVPIGTLIGIAIVILIIPLTVMTVFVPSYIL